MISNWCVFFSWTTWQICGHCVGHLIVAMDHCWVTCPVKNWQKTFAVTHKRWSWQRFHGFDFDHSNSKCKLLHVQVFLFHPVSTIPTRQPPNLFFCHCHARKKRNNWIVINTGWSGIRVFHKPLTTKSSPATQRGEAPLNVPLFEENLHSALLLFLLDVLCH